MFSRYKDEEAAQLARELGPEHGEDLALRVYTSRLLGADPRLVLHGGGNTSVKSRLTETTGEEVSVLFVKGSGGNLATIGPASFPAVRLERLRKLCTLASLTDEQMVKELRGQTVDGSRPQPSVETLLHALVPGKFVDHSHADALLAIADQPDGEAHIRELYGDRVLFVPYAMPGFALAKQFAESFRARVESAGEPELVVLAKHGIFTWGDTAKESYERMIAAVSKAEEALARDVRPSLPRGQARPPRTARTYERTAEGDGDDEHLAARAALSIALRGELQRRADQPWFLAWRASDVLLEAAARPEIAALLGKGCATPDHVIRVKPWPLVLGGVPAGDAPALRAVLGAALDEYAARYRAYFERGKVARGTDPIPLDPWPRVVLVPGLGALAIGRSRRDADIAADIAEHTAAVVLDAASLGAYEPAAELDLFDMEYWSLEQAKLTKRDDATSATGPAALPFGGDLSGKVALVTGAASGIGLATAAMFLRAGAHVCFTDRDGALLADVTRPIEKEHPGRVLALELDVTSFEQAERAVQRTLVRFGGLDILVSNAGSASEGKLHTEAGDRALRFSLELNLMGHQNVARASALAMIAQGNGGALLFNASKSAFNQGPDFGPYAVPKTALLALMRQYAVDLAPQGVRTGAVNADRIRTALFTPAFVEARAKARNVGVDEYFKANLLRRETTADDVAAAFVYLAVAGATTGCVITVDGGNAAAFPR
jgi:rhamnose utilization protein RhaD (predicted bifunctional aldolase and dehydrogenase)/NAD(P)-dependent dehydrogenase (short-subunit alcohol dehydrogenase family)